MKAMFMLYHLLVFLLLLAAAALQLNDPDPLVWGGFYAMCALVPLLAAFRIDIRILYVLCLIYGIVVIAPTVDGMLEYLHHAGTDSLEQMAQDKPYIEEGREFLGALITLGLISVYPVVQWKREARA
jgi:hypothetical protein